VTRYKKEESVVCVSVSPQIIFQIKESRIKMVAIKNQRQSVQALLRPSCLSLSWRLHFINLARQLATRVSLNINAVTAESLTDHAQQFAGYATLEFSRGDTAGNGAGTVGPVHLWLQVTNERQKVSSITTRLRGRFPLIAHGTIVPQCVMLAQIKRQVPLPSCYSLIYNPIGPTRVT
jgi:hypothetical protein